MLRKRIQELQHYRRMGLTSAADIDKYEQDVVKRVCYTWIWNNSGSDHDFVRPKLGQMSQEITILSKDSTLGRVVLANPLLPIRGGDPRAPMVLRSQVLVRVRVQVLLGGRSVSALQSMSLPR